jgi:hypothetical protein
MPGGYNYAWNITVAEMAVSSDLGFALATGSTSNLVWGSSPKPPRASQKFISGVISTFIKPQQSVIDAAVTAGWAVSGINYDLIPEV